MRLVLGTPTEAGCGFGSLIGFATGVAVICVMPGDSFKELAVLLIPAIAAWCTFWGASCGKIGALVRRSPLAAVCGAAIAWLPFLIIRLRVDIGTVNPAELISVAVGAISGLVGSLVGAIVQTKLPKS
jgi:hypothetical protein